MVQPQWNQLIDTFLHPVTQSMTFHHSGLGVTHPQKHQVTTKILTTRVRVVDGELYQ